MPHTNSPLITMKRLLVAMTLNDEVVARAWREQSSIEHFSNRVISYGWSTFEL